MKRALALVLLLSLTRCGALDESAPTRATPHACKTVDEDLKPVLDLVAAGQLSHLANLLQTDLDPSSLRAVLRLVLDAARALPAGTLKKLPDVLSNSGMGGLLPLLTALLEPLPGKPDATPPVPPKTAELQAFSTLAQTCLTSDLFQLLTDLLREPALAPAVDVLLADGLSGAPQLQNALKSSGTSGRAGIVALVHDVMTSMAAPGFDPHPLLTALEGLIDPQAPGILGALDTVMKLATLDAAGQPNAAHLATLQSGAQCLLNADPDGRLVGHLYDVLVGAPIAPMGPSAGKASGTEDLLQLLAYVTEVLAQSQGARDAMGQVFGLILRPDVAVQAVPELVLLLKSDAFTGLFQLIHDLALQPCRNQAVQ